MRKFFKAFGGVVAISATLFFLQSSDENLVAENQEYYKQHPPIPTEFWVQKIKTPPEVVGGGRALHSSFCSLRA
ncbi:MAG: hypothetical protein N4A45_06210 [Flavobacteriales bacterium]|jgi:hypothetical protein|nr:hypothetical protein [Flavobacteriales bacterium]